jgi:dimethylamine/trimethylamine dehydrogenase
VLGGRVLQESRLPMLSEWKRVADYRAQLLATKTNVETYITSRLSAADILAFGFNRVVIATGATWRTDGIGRENRTPIPVAGDATVISPEDILSGRKISGRPRSSRR